ncbi:MAG: hypothetical protein KAI53_04990 [Candidatus Aenigmarchaeota archaeon]|nr:hypothetical protein [Candidatus Aenigmarchaeota archaeon]
MVKTGMKSVIHIDYSDKVKIKRVEGGLRYDAVVEIGDGCELFVSQKQLENLKKEITNTLSSKTN